MSESRACPRCGETIPLELGFDPWCHGCGWNVAPKGPVGELPLSLRVARQLAERSDRALFETLASGDTPDPRRGGSILLAYAIAGLVHLATLGLVALGLRLLWAARNGLWPAIPAALLLAIAWGLRPRLGTLPAPLVEPGAAPGLEALVARVARELGLDDIPRLRLTPDYTASFGRVGWGRTALLELGLPLFIPLPPQEKVALITHQLAHDVTRDPTRTTFIGSAIAALDSWYRAIAPREIRPSRRTILAPAIILFNLIALLLAQLPRALGSALIYLIWPTSQRAEYRADALAARVAGSAAARGLLDRSYLASLFTDTLRVLAFAGGKRNVVREFARRAENLPVREHERYRYIEREHDIRLDRRHPPTHLRRALLEQGQARPTVVLSERDHAPILEELEPWVERFLVVGERGGAG